MELSIFIAKILAIVYIAFGIGMLINSDYYSKIGQDYTKNSGLVAIWGIMALVLGSAIVLKHNIWEPSWIVVITIFGWLALLEGTLVSVFTKPTLKIVEKMITKTSVKYWGIVALVIGLFFGYLGFFM